MKEFTSKELEQYKDVLLQLRSRYRCDVSSMKNTAIKKEDHEGSTITSTIPLHMADIGTDTYEQEFAFSLMEAGAGRLSEIENALRRIQDGTFGVCQQCQSRITKKRLEAIPYATLCIKCASGKR